jgi:hypothetical protein
MSSDAGNPDWTEIERALAAVLELPEEQVKAAGTCSPGGRIAADRASARGQFSRK